MTENAERALSSLLEEMESNPNEARELAAARLGLRALKALQEAMASSGISQVQLATSLGISESAVSQTVNGDGNIRLHTFGRYLRALGYQATLDLVDMAGQSIVVKSARPKRAEKVTPSDALVTAAILDSTQVTTRSNGVELSLPLETATHDIVGVRVQNFSSSRSASVPNFALAA